MTKTILTVEEYDMIIEKRQAELDQLCALRREAVNRANSNSKEKTFHTNTKIIKKA